MNRREFIITTGSVAVATTMPALAAPVKYPLIGQPIIGLLFSQKTWDETGEYFQKTFHKRIHSMKDHHRGMEVFLSKHRANAYTGVVSPYANNVPHMMAANSYNMVDLETFKLIKSRFSDIRVPFLEIPEGANRDLVVKNRIEYLDHMGFARNALGPIG